MSKTREILLTKEYLNKLFYYDPETGKLFNKITRLKAKKDMEAGCLIFSKKSNLYYRKVKIDTQFFFYHRIIWIMHYVHIPENMEMDHIDGNGLNNNLNNLRLVNHKDNNKNTSLQKNNTSGFLGVSWHKPLKKWRAYVMVDRKHIHLGVFKNKEDAIKARMEANKKYDFHENHGRKEKINVINDKV